MRTALLLVALLAASSVHGAHEWCENLPDGDLKKWCRRGRDAIQAANAGDNKRKLLTYTPGQYVGSFQTFLQDMMGGNWTDYVPSAWTNTNFDWSKLGTFDYTSNMQYFVDAIYMKNITAPKTLKDVHDNMEVISSIFCTPETYVPPQKVFATCVGPKVTLAYVPKVCVLEEATQQVVCDPAKIVLVKSAGGCTHKYVSAAQWKAKECKIKGGVGFSNKVQYGGNAYTIPLTQFSAGYQP